GAVLVAGDIAQEPAARRTVLGNHNVLLAVVLKAADSNPGGARVGEKADGRQWVEGAVAIPREWFNRAGQRARRGAVAEARQPDSEVWLAITVEVRWRNGFRAAINKIAGNGSLKSAIAVAQNQGDCAGAGREVKRNRQIELSISIQIGGSEARLHAVGKGK